jgi:hypothetical protein
MLNLFQHPWPGAIPPARRQLFFAQSHKVEGNGRPWTLKQVQGDEGEEAMACASFPISM